MNETAEEESTSLEEQSYVNIANIFQQHSSVPCERVFSRAGHVVNAK